MLYDAWSRDLGSHLEDGFERARFVSRFVIQAYARQNSVLEETSRQHGVPRKVFLDHLRRSVLAGLSEK